MVAACEDPALVAEISTCSLRSCASSNLRKACWEALPLQAGSERICAEVECSEVLKGCLWGLQKMLQMQ